MTMQEIVKAIELLSKRALELVTSSNRQSPDVQQEIRAILFVKARFNGELGKITREEDGRA